MAAGDYAFGSRILDDGATYFVIERELPGTPVDLLAYPLGRYEGSVVSDWHYDEPEAMLRIGVWATTQAANEAAVDTLLKDLYNGQQNLKLGYADERYWRARLAGAPSVDKRTHAAQIVEVHFRTATAFGYALAASSLSNASALSLVSGTHYSKTLQPTVGGTIYSRPVITITMSASGPYGTTSVWLVNNSVSPAQLITVNRAFAASDVLVIDCAALTVRVNGTEVEYSGQFPILDPRVGTTNDIVLHTTSTSTPTLTCALAWTSRFAD